MSCLFIKIPGKYLHLVAMTDVHHSATLRVCCHPIQNSDFQPILDQHHLGKKEEELESDVMLRCKISDEL